MQEKFEDTKQVMTIRSSEKDNKCNDKKKKIKRVNNDIQNITKKTKERATRTLLKTGG